MAQCRLQRLLVVVSISGFCCDFAWLSPFQTFLVATSCVIWWRTVWSGRFWWHPGVIWWPSGWCWWCGEWRLMARHHGTGEAVVVLVQLSHAGTGTRWRPAPGPSEGTLHQMVTEGGQHCDGGAGPLHQARWPWLSRKLSPSPSGERRRRKPTFDKFPKFFAGTKLPGRCLTTTV